MNLFLKHPKFVFFTCFACTVFLCFCLEGCYQTAPPPKPSEAPSEASSNHLNESPSTPLSTAPTTLSSTPWEDPPEKFTPSSLQAFPMFQKGVKKIVSTLQAQLEPTDKNDWTSNFQKLTPSFQTCLKNEILFKFQTLKTIEKNLDQASIQRELNLLSDSKDKGLKAALEADPTFKPWKFPPNSWENYFFSKTGWKDALEEWQEPDGETPQEALLSSLRDSFWEQAWSPLLCQEHQSLTQEPALKNLLERTLYSSPKKKLLFETLVRLQVLKDLIDQQQLPLEAYQDQLQALLSDENAKAFLDPTSIQTLQAQLVLSK